MKNTAIIIEATLTRVLVEAGLIDKPKTFAPFPPLHLANAERRVYCGECDLLCKPYDNECWCCGTTYPPTDMSVEEQFAAWETYAKKRGAALQRKQKRTRNYWLGYKDLTPEDFEN